MTLYYISLFNYSRNQYARFMVSAYSEEEAKKKAFHIVGLNYKLSTITAVCKTDELVFIEL